MPAEAPLDRDAVIGGFRIVHLVGEGAMGEVYLAQDLTLGRRVALKLIKRAVMQSNGLTQFLDEARVTASFSHPHIVTIHAFGEHDGRPFLALEYLDGETLRERIHAAPLPVMAALRVMRAVADAVAEAHRHGLVHADLKPENLFMPRDGRVRVLDFGLARTSGASGGASGTPAYMAPERWRGTPMTGAADVWSLGLILYELIAGRRLFGDAELAQLAFGAASVTLPVAVVGEAWGDAVAKCLAIDPSQRPSAVTLAQWLDHLLDPSRDDDGSERGPFPGLFAFTRADAAHYVGRQAELDALIEQLRERPLVPIVGPSGTGKSSFVHAALIPRLEEQGRWRIASCRPGDAPFTQLTNAVLDAPDPALSAALHSAPERLSLVLRTHVADGYRLLLVIDQFEEVFTLAPNDARAFCACLGMAADPAAPWRIVLTMRDDFFGRVAESQALRPHLGAVMVLAPMSVAELRAAVTSPLARAGYRCDVPELSARIAADVVDQPACLPLLQFACHALWQRRDTSQRTLSTHEYEAIGGAAGALASHAQRLMQQLSVQQVRVARALFLGLIHPDGTRRPRSRADLLEGFPGDAAPVIDRLLEGRLLVASRKLEHDDAMLELSHESLATTWPQLGRWLDETHEQRALVHEIEQASVLWDRRGRRDVETWSGLALEDAVRRVAEWDVSLSSAARAFLQAGIARAHRTRRRRRTTFVAALAVLGAAAVGASLAAVAYSRKEREAIEQQTQIKLASADIGVFELALEPFDWDPVRQDGTAPASLPTLTWRLRAVAVGAERVPAAAYGADDLHHGTPAWQGGALVERVEAKSAPTFLEIDRGACPPSVIFLQRLPGYPDRHAAPPTLHIAVPTCQASAADSVTIPGGAFYKNANPADGADTADALTTLPAFSIDRTEVTRAAFAVYAAMEPLTGDGVARADSSQPPVEADKRLPVVGINFATARNYCRFLGKDLPTVEQWQKAFRGGLQLAGAPNPNPRRPTPWLHTTSSHPTNVAYTGDGQVAPVGSFPDDTSPYGVVDLSGNVAEWSLSHPVPHKLHGLRMLLGAAWDQPADRHLQEITWRNARHDRYLDFAIGMRCVANQASANVVLPSAEQY